MACSGITFVYFYYTEGKFLKLDNVRFEERMAMNIVGCGAL
jgi:hypothetical protein